MDMTQDVIPKDRSHAGSPAHDSDASDDSSNNSNGESTEEEQEVDWLATGREKRSTAGNRLSTLLDQEDAEDEVNLVFADNGEEDVEFLSDDASEEDDKDDSDSDDSSADEDGGDGGDDELAGEKQLQKEERAQKRSEKRKADTMLRKPPRAAKRVKITEPTAPNSKPTIARPKKKSERVSWLPNLEQGQIRSSSRALSQKNKERTLASIKENAEKRKRILVKQEAQSKRKESDYRPMTQEDHLTEAARVEQENSQSLHKYEEMEQERLRKQKARLDALQNRKLEGPVIRWISRPARWVDGRLKQVGKVEIVEDTSAPRPKVGRPKSTAKMQKEAAAPSQRQSNTPQGSQTLQSRDLEGPHVNESNTSQVSAPRQQAATDELTSQAAPAWSSETKADGEQVAYVLSEVPSQAPSQATQLHDTHSSIPSQPTSQAAETKTEEAQLTPVLSTPTASVLPKVDELHETPSQLSTPQSSRTAMFAQSSGGQPTSVELSNQAGIVAPTPSEPQTLAAIPPPPPPPPKVERSHLNTISFVNFDHSVARNAELQKRILFAWHELDHSAGSRSNPNKPVKRTQHQCGISGQSARYLDPSTGVPYKGLREYKALHSLVDSYCVTGERDEVPADAPVWSQLFKAWVGRSSPAKGVPPGFLNRDELRPEEPPQPEPAAQSQQQPQQPLSQPPQPDHAQQPISEPAVKTEPSVSH